MRHLAIVIVLVGALPACRAVAADDVEGASRPRARDLGIVVGSLPTGKHDAITDVPGVRVGHVTLREGDSIRTGVTAIVPHSGDVFRDKVPAAFACFNGFGKPFGTVQIDELGTMETPLLLGPTPSVPRIADGIIDHVLRRDSSGTIRSVNPAVGETNDGWLSDIRARPIRSEHVRRAIESARPGPVEEGAVGAGTGTRALGYKGGIGTASRRMATKSAGEVVVGVLVQTNFGGELRILGRSFPAGQKDTERRAGSCAIVVATDAPVDARQLKRLARRTFAGMARTGASFSHGSGDYAFAFSTERGDASRRSLPDRELTPLLRAVADATEEAIYNSILRATTVRGRDGHVAQAIDVERVRRVFSSGAPRVEGAER